MNAPILSSDTTPPDAAQARALLESLYNAAVARALPAHVRAQAQQGQPGDFALAADTNGIDGVEVNAGAFVEPRTLARAAALGHKVEQHLDRNDAYGFFEPLGDLIMTGPTFTNVNDFRAILVL